MHAPNMLHFFCTSTRGTLCCSSFALVVLLVATQLYGCVEARLQAKSYAVKDLLYCNISVPCTPCGHREARIQYCKDTGFKEELSCTGTLGSNERYQVTVEGQATQRDTAILIHRPCNSSIAEDTQDTYSLNQHHVSYMSLFHFELVMLLVLGISLPVVYWRKKRVWHL